MAVTILEAAAAAAAVAAAVAVAVAVADRAQQRVIIRIKRPARRGVDDVLTLYVICAPQHSRLAWRRRTQEANRSILEKLSFQ